MKIQTLTFTNFNYMSRRHMIPIPLESLNLPVKYEPNIVWIRRRDPDPKLVLNRFEIICLRDI